jgi:2-hydroxychromene-2-carboxylate isomerase
MSPELEVLFDYGSPFSYLANLQIEGLAKRNGAAVTYIPVLLGVVLKATGNASPMTIPAKGRYMATELRRWAARYGVAFKPNPHGFMSNTLRLMHGAMAAQANGWFDLYHCAIYRATRAEAQNLGDDTVTQELLENVGAPGTTLMVDIKRQEANDRLRQSTDRAVERGVFGAPTLFVGSEMFWGNDCFDFVEAGLRKLV